MVNVDVISMPDKWEIPGTPPGISPSTVLMLVDADFGKAQLELLLKSRYCTPAVIFPRTSGSATRIPRPRLVDDLRLFGWIKRSGRPISPGRALSQPPSTWWVNRKDRAGNNAFEGGFLGLDNIGVFDRSSPLPTGGYSGTSRWHGLDDPLLSHGPDQRRAGAGLYRPMSHDEIPRPLPPDRGGVIWWGEEGGMWDEEDAVYDVLRLPDGQSERLKVRSMVGLLPFCAVTVFEKKLVNKYPEVAQTMRGFFRHARR